MKILSYTILAFIFFACNESEQVEVSSIDKDADANIRNSQGPQENQSEVSVKLPIEVRIDKIKPLLVRDLSDEKIKAIDSEIKSAFASSDDSNAEKIFTAS
jgi:hypothetical protein